MYTNKDAINHCLRSCTNTISTHNECMRVWLAMASTNGLNQFQKYVNAVYRKAQRHSGERQKKKKKKKRKKRKKKKGKKEKTRMSRCDDSPKDVRNNEYKELYRDVRDM